MINRKESAANRKALDNLQMNRQKRIMVAEEVKFDIQTEGLGEFWGVAPSYRDRRSRDPMSADELLEIILTILDENGEEANGLFIIEHSHNCVHIRLDNGALVLSDPNDANYQNVAISIDDLKASLADFFSLRKDGTKVQNTHVIILQWIIALVAGGGMVAAFYFAFHHLKKEVEFMPNPEFVEVRDQKDFSDHLKELTGIYITELQDGETLLHIQEDGRWDFYDMEKGKGRNFVLTKVEEGLCRPIYQKGRLALLTDSNFLFYWESEGILKFQDRRYTRTAKSMAELSFVRLPN
jgi:hypothetical protein